MGSKLNPTICNTHDANTQNTLIHTYWTDTHNLFPAEISSILSQKVNSLIYLYNLKMIQYYFQTFKCHERINICQTGKPSHICLHSSFLFHGCKPTSTHITRLPQWAAVGPECLPSFPWVYETTVANYWVGQKIVLSRIYSHDGTDIQHRSSPLQIEPKILLVYWHIHGSTLT